MDIPARFITTKSEQGRGQEGGGGCLFEDPAPSSRIPGSVPVRPYSPKSFNLKKRWFNLTVACMSPRLGARHVVYSITAGVIWRKTSHGLDMFAVPSTLSPGLTYIDDARYKIMGL